MWHGSSDDKSTSVTATNVTITIITPNRQHHRRHHHHHHYPSSPPSPAQASLRPTSPLPPSLLLHHHHSHHHHRYLVTTAVTTAVTTSRRHDLHRHHHPQHLFRRQMPSSFPRRSRDGTWMQKEYDRRKLGRRLCEPCLLECIAPQCKNTISLSLEFLNCALSLLSFLCLTSSW